MHDTSLLPDDYLADARERRTNIVGLALFALVLGGVAVWFTRTNFEWREVRDRQEQVSASFSAVAVEIRDMQEQEKTRREMLEKAQLAASLVDPVPRSILLAELVRRMPEKVSLLEFELRSEPVKVVRAKPVAEAATAGPRSRAAAARGKAKPVEKAEPPKPDPLRYAIALTITGLAPTDLDVSEYLQNLNQLDLLESVRLEVSEEKQVGGLPTRQFRIAIRLGPDADVRSSRSLLPATIAEAEAMEPREFEPGFARPFMTMPEEPDAPDAGDFRADAAPEEMP
jgi:Tfp pilus assembly protein PilN